jgi:hypothetical protein
MHALDSGFPEGMRIPLVLAALVCYASAGVFIGLVPYTNFNVQPNGTVIAEDARTLTFECNQGDPVMAYQVGVDRWTVSTCSQPTQSYIAEAKKYQPRDMHVYRTRMCTSENPYDFNANSTVPGNVLSNANRRLLAAERGLSENDVYTYDEMTEVLPFVRAWRKFQYSNGLTAEQKLQMIRSTERHPTNQYDVMEYNKPYSADNTQHDFDLAYASASSAYALLSDAARVARKSCVGAAFGVAVVYCPWMNTMSPSDVTHVADLEADKALNNATSFFLNALNTTVYNQMQINSGFNTVLQQQGWALGNNTVGLATAAFTLKFIQQEIDNLTSAATVAIANLYENIATTAMLEATYTDTQVNALQTQMILDFQQLIAIVQQLSDREYNDNALNNNRLMTLAQTILDNGNVLYHSLAGTNRYVDREDKELFFFSMDQISAVGFVPFIRPSQPGSRPIPLASIPDSRLRIYIDITQVNYLESHNNGLSTINRTHQHTVSLYCNVDYMSEQLPDQITIEAAFGLVGPVGCLGNATTSGVNPVRTCNCWWSISHKYCDAAPGFDWAKINSVAGREAYNLVPAYCAGDTQPLSGPNDGQQIDSLPVFLNYLGNLSCNTHPELANSQFQMVNTRSGVVTVAPNYAPAVCNISYNSLFVTGTITVPTLPQAMFVNWVNVYPTLKTERAMHEIDKYGVRAVGTTSVFVPIVTASNGVTVQCYDSSIASTSTDTNIIYRLTQQPLETLVTTATYDQAPDCTTTPGTCIPQGNLISSVTSTAFTQATIGSGEGLATGTLLLSELVSGGQSFVVDAPQNTKCLSPDPITCYGTNGYLSWNFPDGYVVAEQAFNPAIGDLSVWEADNPGELFDHNAPTSAGFWEVPLVDGVCQTIPGQDQQELCDFLNRYSVYPTTNMRAGGLVTSPKTWSMLVTLNIGLGTLSTYVTEGCPTVAFGGGGLGGTFVRISNPSNSQMFSSMSRSLDVNATCAVVGNLGNVDVPLAPYQTVDIALPACGNVTIQIFRKSFATGDLLPCGPPLLAFVSSVTQSNVITSDTIGNVTTEVIQNAVTASLATSALSIIDFMLQLTYSAAQAANPQLNFTYAELVQSTFVNSSLDDFIRQLRIDAAAVDLNNPAASAYVFNLTDQLLAEVAAARAAEAAATDTLAGIQVLLAQNAADVARLSGSITDLQAALAAKSAADQAEINAILNGQGSGGTSCNIMCYLTYAFIAILVCCVGGIAYKIYGLAKTAPPPPRVAGMPRYDPVDTELQPYRGRDRSPPPDVIDRVHQPRQFTAY